MSLKKLITNEKFLDVENLKVELFFVQRSSKTRQNKKTFTFITKKVDSAEILNKYFISTAKQFLEKKLSSTDLKIEDYTVIAEDTPNLVHKYKYANSLECAPSIWQKIFSSDTKNIASLNEIKDNLWAYCVRISKNNKSLILFRKTSPTKIATDGAQTLKDKFYAMFDSTDARLDAVSIDSISFDGRIDCILLENEFYIFSKNNFEKIVNLEQEFIENAQAVTDEIINQNIVEGVELLISEVHSKPSLMRMIANIARKQNHSAIGQVEIEKMKHVLRTFESRDLKLTTTGKILIEDKTDVEDFLKLLNDYHKIAMVSGKYYGSSSGQIIEAH